MAISRFHPGRFVAFFGEAITLFFEISINTEGAGAAGGRWGPLRGTGGRCGVLGVLGGEVLPPAAPSGPQRPPAGMAV